MNAGTDNEVLDAAKKAHEEGKGPGVSLTLVQPNGAQLQQVGGKPCMCCGGGGLLGAAAASCSRLGR